MNLRSAIIAALLTPLLAAVAHAAITPGEAEVLKRDVERGAMIYGFDQAAWVSTDEMLKHFPDPRAAGLGGYVVEPSADGTVRAIYYRMDGATPLAMFVADIRDGKVVGQRVIQGGAEAQLSAVASRMIRARDAASAAVVAKGWQPCTPAAFNTVVLPPATAGGPISVYFLTPQVQTGEYPFGGHYEVDVAADGSIASSRAFTKSCLVVGQAGVPSGGKPVAAVVSHLLDPTPTEIHVYLSLWMKQPVYVVTGAKRIWVVNGDSIAEANK